MNFRFVFALTGLLCLGAARAQTETTLKTANDIRVECADPEIQKSAEEFFRSEKDLSEAIRRFYFRWPILNIALFQDPDDPHRVRITIDISPLVSAIEVRSQRLIKNREVIENLEMRVGDRVVPSRLDRVRGRLRDYYLFRGYPQAQVKVDVETGLQPQEGMLVVQVTEGPPCIISGVQLRYAPDVVPPGRLERELKVKAGDRCDLEKIREGADRVLEELRDRERLAAEVKDPELIYSEDRTQAVLSMNVIMGPKIRVRFLGNTFSFERNGALEEAIDLDHEHQFGSSWPEGVAAEGIRSFYRSNGYPEAKVQVEDRTDDETDTRTITLHIQRGRKVHLKNIGFEGNHSISGDDLLDQFWKLAPPLTYDKVFVQEELTPVALGLEAYYQTQGYLRAQFDEPKITPRDGGKRMDVMFRVREGPQSILKKINFSGHSVLSTSDLQDEMNVDDNSPVNLVKIKEGADRIAERYHGMGYKFAAVDIPRLEDVPEGEVEIPVAVREGAQVRIGQVSLRGHFHTNENVIRRELKIREGDIYNPEKIRDSRRNLVRLGFFQSVAVEEIGYDPATGKEDLLITVQERKKRTVIFRPGFSTDDGVRGALTLGYINMGGTGRSATVTGQVSRQIEHADITENKVVFTYREPHFLGLGDGRINLIEERAEEQQFDIDRASVILGIDRELLRWLRGTVQWELEFRDPFHVEPGAVLSPIDEEKARFGSIANILDFDFRDDILSPTKGTFHRVKFDVFNNGLGSEEEFYQVTFRNNFYVPLYRKIRTVLSVRFGFSATYDKTKNEGIAAIPIEKRFRLGGNASLRGFDRNCVGGLPSDVPENCSDAASSEAPGGNSMFNYMVDLLLPIGKGFDFAIFTDGGNAYPSNSDFDPLNIRTTAGAGIRYNTFFGPLRLDYGFKLDRRTGESIGELHFAVGQL